MTMQSPSWAYIQRQNMVQKDPWPLPSVHCSGIYSGQDIEQPKRPLTEE